MAVAAWELQIALVAALKADPGVAEPSAEDGSGGAGGRVYSGVAPATAPKGPRYVVGSATEIAFPTFGRTGDEGTVQLHIWSPFRDNEQVLRLYGFAKRALHRKRLPMDSHRMIRGTLELITNTPDPDGVFQHGIAVYRVISQEIA